VGRAALCPSSVRIPPRPIPHFILFYFRPSASLTRHPVGCEQRLSYKSSVWPSGVYLNSKGDILRALGPVQSLLKLVSFAANLVDFGPCPLARTSECCGSDQCPGCKRGNCWEAPGIFTSIFFFLSTGHFVVLKCIYWVGWIKARAKSLSIFLK